MPEVTIGRAANPEAEVDLDVLALRTQFEEPSPLDQIVRDGAQSWYELLMGLKQRGLEIAAKLATGDGALLFWAALRKVYGKTREPRCWVHETGNVLNNMPKSVQPKANLHEIWIAATREDAEKEFDQFLEKYAASRAKGKRGWTWAGTTR